MSTYTSATFLADLSEPYAWPGGYPRFFLLSDGEALSFESAKTNQARIVEAIDEQSNDGWCVIACDVNWEDSTLTCADSGKPIESAYGE